MRITYVSLVDASEICDISHISDNWRGKGKRQDYVLLDGGNGAILFAQILGLFQLRLGTNRYGIALVRIFKYHGREKLSETIQLEDVDEIEFVFIESCIRPAHVLPPLYEREGPPRFLANDLVDHDMLIRLEALE